MKMKLSLLMLLLFFVAAGCAPTSHFGVENQAIVAPGEFAETEAVIAGAEKSEGARHCPEKIARAREMAREAVEIYWACRTANAMTMLAEARQLAREAEACQPPPRVEPAPPPKPAPDPPPMAPLHLPSALFGFDRSDLTSEAIAELDYVADYMRKNPGVKVQIQGHTDNIGPEAYNEKLGYRRAQAAFDYLVGEGIAADRLEKVSFGEREPIANNETTVGRSLNRRVSLIPIR